MIFLHCDQQDNTINIGGRSGASLGIVNERPERRGQAAAGSRAVAENPGGGGGARKGTSACRASSNSPILVWVGCRRQQTVAGAAARTRARAQ